MPLDIGGNVISSTSINTSSFSKSIISNGLLLNVDAANVNSYSGSGSTWYDLSKNKMNGSIQGVVTYTSSNTGVFSFDNSSSSYVLF